MEATENSDESLCTECTEVDAEVRCESCACNLCIKCFDLIHSTSKYLRNHTYIEISIPARSNVKGSLSQYGDTAEQQEVGCGQGAEGAEPSLEEEPRVCKKHGDRPIEFYCETDGQLICSYCIVKDSHRNHDVITLEDLDFKRKEKVIKEAEEAVSSLQSLSERAQSLINDRAAVEVEQLELIDSKFNHIQHILANRRKCLLEELKSFCSSETIQLKSTADEINKRISLLKENISVLRTVDTDLGDVTKRVSTEIRRVLSLTKPALPLSLTVLDLMMRLNVMHIYCDRIKIVLNIKARGLRFIPWFISSLISPLDDFDVNIWTEVVAGFSLNRFSDDVELAVASFGAVIKPGGINQISTSLSNQTRARQVEHSASSSNETLRSLESNLQTCDRPLEVSQCPFFPAVQDVRNADEFGDLRDRNLGSHRKVEDGKESNGTGNRSTAPHTYHEIKQDNRKKATDSVNHSLIKYIQTSQSSPSSFSQDNHSSGNSASEGNRNNELTARPSRDFSDFTGSFVSGLADSVSGSTVRNITGSGDFNCEVGSPVDNYPAAENKQESHNIALSLTASGDAALDASQKCEQYTLKLNNLTGNNREESLVESSVTTTVNDCQENLRSKLKVAKAIPPAVGSEQCCMVVLVNSPADFCVQFISDNENLLRLREALGQHCQETLNSGNTDDEIEQVLAAEHHRKIQELETGDFVLAQYEADQNWYRAKITHVHVPGTRMQRKFDVIFVDYGNTDTVLSSSIKIMEDDRFCLMPAMSHDCTLGGVRPYGRGWTREACYTFSTLTTDRLITAKILSIDEESRLIVELLLPACADVSNDCIQSVADVMFFLHLADYTSHTSNKSSTAKHPKSAGKLIQHVQPKMGQSLSALLTAISSSKDTFYIQAMAPDLKKMDESMKEMMSLYNSDKSSLYFLLHPQPGDVCAASMEFEGQCWWYRSEVVACDTWDNVKVKHVDFGGSVKTSVWQIRKIPDLFLNIPAQAIQCRLDTRCGEGVDNNNIRSLCELHRGDKVTLTVQDIRQEKGDWVLLVTVRRMGLAVQSNSEVTTSNASSSSELFNLSSNNGGHHQQKGLSQIGKSTMGNENQMSKPGHAISDRSVVQPGSSCSLSGPRFIIGNDSSHMSSSEYESDCKAVQMLNLQSRAQSLHQHLLSSSSDTEISEIQSKVDGTEKGMTGGKVIKKRFKKKSPRESKIEEVSSSTSVPSQKYPGVNGMECDLSYLPQLPDSILPGYQSPASQSLSAAQPQTLSATLSQPIPAEVAQPLMAPVPQSLLAAVLQSLPASVPQSLPASASQSLSASIPQSLLDPVPKPMPALVPQPLSAGFGRPMSHASPLTPYNMLGVTQVTAVPCSVFVPISHNFHGLSLVSPGYPVRRSLDGGMVLPNPGLNRPASVAAGIDLMGHTMGLAGGAASMGYPAGIVNAGQPNSGVNAGGNVSNGIESLDRPVSALGNVEYVNLAGVDRVNAWVQNNPTTIETNQRLAANGAQSSSKQSVDKVDNGTASDMKSTAENSDVSVGACAGEGRGDKTVVGGGGESGSRGKEVIVSHVVSPYEIYVRDASRTSQSALKRLMRELNGSTPPPPVPPGSQWTVGQLCMAPYVSVSEYKWYRAFIKSIDTAYAMVLLIDYGMTVVVMLADLHPLPVHPPSIHTLRHCAECCTLHGLSPAATDNQWSDGATQLIRNLTTGKRCFADVKLDAQEASLVGNGVLAIDLLYEEKVKGGALAPDTITLHDIASSLILSGHAVSTLINTSSDKLSVLPLVTTEQPSSQSLIPSTGSHSDYALPVRPSATTVGVVVTHFDENGNLYLQQYTGEDDSDRLESFIERIHDCYSHSARESESTWGVKQPVVARFHDDGKFYRGRVMGFSDHGVKVMFVDYGNIELVNKEDLRKIREEFLVDPVKCYTCTLASIIPVGGQWSKVAVSIVKRLTHMNKCRMKIKSVDESTMNLSVRLILEDGRDLSKLLVSCGHASLVDDDDDDYDDDDDDNDTRFEISDHVLNLERQMISPYVGMEISSMADVAGSAMYVQVTQVDRPDVVYIQHMKLDDNLEDRQLVEQDSQLQQLDEQLQQLLNINNIYATAADSYDKIDRAAVSQGMACVARFSVDDCWYRGVVVDVPWLSAVGATRVNQRRVGVRFIDYGSFEYVPVSRLRVIPEEHLCLPALCLRCRLASVTLPDDPELTSLMSREMKRLFADASLIAVPRTIRNGELSVDLYDKQSFSSRGVGARLIYAELINVFSPNNSNTHRDSDSDVLIESD